MIEAFGRPEAFYSKYFISSVSPLGFTKGGKNLNYPDIKDLQSTLEKFILNSLRKQISFGASTRVAFCMGEDQNFKNLSRRIKKRNYSKK
jgi:Domain of unknown function (DUF4918)